MHGIDGRLDERLWSKKKSLTHLAGLRDGKMMTSATEKTLDDLWLSLVMTGTGLDDFPMYLKFHQLTNSYSSEGFKAPSPGRVGHLTDHNDSISDSSRSHDFGSSGND